MFVEGEIDKNDYQITKTRYENILQELKSKEKDCFDKKEIIHLYQKGLSQFENIDKQYNETDIEGKRMIIGSIFPNKIHFENKKIRTADVNPILNKIVSFNRTFGGIKKWDSTKKLELSHSVTSTGFKPVTLRAEI